MDDPGNKPSNNLLPPQENLEPTQAQSSGEAAAPQPEHHHVTTTATITASASAMVVSARRKIRAWDEKHKIILELMLGLAWFIAQLIATRFPGLINLGIVAGSWLFVALALYLAWDVINWDPTITVGWKIAATIAIALFIGWASLILNPILSGSPAQIGGPTTSAKATFAPLPAPHQKLKTKPAASSKPPMSAPEMPTLAPVAAMTQTASMPSSRRTLYSPSTNPTRKPRLNSAATHTSGPSPKPLPSPTIQALVIPTATPTATVTLPPVVASATWIPKNASMAAANGSCELQTHNGDWVPVAEYSQREPLSAVVSDLKNMLNTEVEQTQNKHIDDLADVIRLQTELYGPHHAADWIAAINELDRTGFVKNATSKIGQAGLWWYINGETYERCYTDYSLDVI